ncbi:hypothetical protein ACIGFK_13425 [Streptomyces sp. NPDC085524]|uniref:hypothetical protein n=1 Tax=Streptomyces sp. NPDC085524 TaxID=3365728 RepID=UPI0037CDBCC9
MTPAAPRSYLGMDFDDLMTQPGERLPLLTRGEAGALIALLGQLADGADENLRRAAGEIQARIGMRLPAE